MATRALMFVVATSLTVTGFPRPNFLHKAVGPMAAAPNPVAESPDGLESDRLRRLIMGEAEEEGMNLATFAMG
jgi:hypothetical protein